MNLRPSLPPSRRIVHSILLTLAVFLALGAGDDRRFDKLGHGLMCICGCNQVLLECNHVGCRDSDRMRNELTAAMNSGSGSSDDTILQGFVQKYGMTVLAAPTTSGFNYVAWIIPFVALGLGIVFLVMVVRNWKSRPAPALADGIPSVHGSDLERFRQQARKETEL